MKYTKTALTVAACAALNFVLMLLPGKLNLPLFLNAYGTCFACYFSGIYGGLICAAVTGLFAAPLGTSSVMYCAVNIIFAAVFSFCLKKELLYRFLTTLISGFWLGVICAVFGTFTNSIFHEGYTLNAWGDALFDMLRHYGVSKGVSSFAATAFIEVIDKQLCVLIFLLVIELISMYKNKRAEKSVDDIKNKTVSTVLIICVLAMLFKSVNVSAASGTQGHSDNKGFATQIFDKRDGLLLNSVSTIGQTDDGFIWIGSTSGLLKYDGSSFEHMFPGEITNVTALLSDSEGRLLIGTVDSGLFVYEDGNLKSYTTANGLPSNAVRCIAEKGSSIYVGTSDKIFRLDGSSIKIIDEDITYAYKMCVSGNILIGCDINGHLFALDKNDSPVNITKPLDTEFFTCIENTSKGVAAGSDKNFIYYLNVSSDMVSVNSMMSSDIEGMLDMCEDREGRQWICSETALGYYDTSGRFRRRHCADTLFTYESLFVDYQNNIWVTSSKYGLMKLSESNFLYLSERAGLPSVPVNSAAKYKGLYYYGTDEGLHIHDRAGNTEITNELTKVLDGKKVLAMLADNKNRLWILTSNSYGIIIYDGKGIEYINKDNSSITSDNCRCIARLKDNSIAVGTSDGINFIKDDKVVNGGEHLMSGMQVLCLLSCGDGLLYAGTDGGGICVFEDGKLIKEYTVKDGLSSDVILSLLEYDGGVIVSTSSKLCYIKDNNVKVLNNYPYNGTCDIVKYDDDNAYMLGQEGVIDLSLSQLVSDSAPYMTVYDEDSGLKPGISRYSQNFADDDGSLIFCTNTGVLSFSKINRYSDYNIKYGVTSVACDGKEITGKDGFYEIPKDTKYISISASVRDYALEDTRVKFFAQDETEVNSNKPVQTVNFRKIPQISIYDPKPGKHVVYLQIYDENEQLIGEKTYVLSRDMRMWEHAWFKLYAIFVAVEAIMVISASLVLLYIMTRRKNELEDLRVDLERAVEEKTKDIVDQQIRTVMALSDAIDAKDRYTSGHSARVAYYSKQIASRLGKSKDEQEMIYRAALLHDIGKIRVPGSIISKPGRLTEDEYMLMKLHPVTGYHILKGIAGESMFAQGAHYHHERYDGRGYPNGLSGENIPEVARIIGVADAYDAMSSRRSYHDTFSQEYIRNEIIRGKGTQFDPDIAQIMLTMIDEDNLYSMREGDGHRVVLVIDDKQKRIDEIRDIMRDENKYTILGALSGEVGLSILEETKVDMCLLDMTMPGMDGVETLKHIRKKHSIPVVLMIEVEKLYNMQLASDLGSDDFLTKPFVPIVLKEIVHNYTKTFENSR